MLAPGLVPGRVLFKVHPWTGQVNLMAVLEHLRSRVLLVTGVHGQRVPHAHGLQVLAGVRWCFAGEELEDGVVHREQPLGYCQADAGGGEALAQRVERMRG
jgi:hypothetical protein